MEPVGRSAERGQRRARAEHPGEARCRRGTAPPGPVIPCRASLAANTPACAELAAEPAFHIDSRPSREMRSARFDVSAMETACAVRPASSPSAFDAPAAEPMATCSEWSMNFVEGFCTSPSPQNTSYAATIATSASRPLSPSDSDSVSVAAIVSLGCPAVHREVRVVEVEVAHHQLVGERGRVPALVRSPVNHTRAGVAAPGLPRQRPRDRRRLPVLPTDGTPYRVDEAHLHPVDSVRRDVVAGQSRNVGAEVLGQRVHDAGHASRVGGAGAG